ncbi:MAG: hypothetical protein OdinLCB4_005695 [Candidatus Odinarchaeum yellowstonii]|uniref:Amphi-Trp domain-containing protein n=1 Tax=Odinarchaeota yellowstonii (strain LCB_4) TaxID=1841599 RepID=A0AAF0D1K6_ODILC|nr:MAG: hypothetical protein OdinLCB4_005695 [Candidatus Odinarchaeum yellowstonii]
MVKISYSKKITIGDLTRLLRELLEVAEKRKESITVEGIPVPLSFNKSLELELDLEIGESESELELSLEWSKHESAEASREIAKAIEGLEESPHVEVEAPVFKGVEDVSRIQTVVSEQKEIITGNRVEVGEKESLDVEKRLDEVISALSSEKSAEIKKEEEIDLKPQGNLLKISEEKTNLEIGGASTSGLQFKIPEYKSVTEPPSPPELEKQELEVEETGVENKEEDSTEELERILKALKESRLTDEDNKEQ